MPSHHIHQPLPQRKSRPPRALSPPTSSFSCSLTRCWWCWPECLFSTYRHVSRHCPRIRGRCQETWRTHSTRAPRSASLEARGCAQESVFTASTVKCVALGIATRGMHGLAVIWFECRPRVPVMLSRAAGVRGETRGWANAGLHEPFGSNHHQLNNNGRSTVSVNQAGQWLREVH